MIVFITGFMGSGKSKIGRELAKETGWNFIDTDTEMEKHTDMSIRDIFQKKGEPFFRQLEEEVISKICRTTQHSVVSLGGGALMSERSLSTVQKAGFLVYIQSSPDEIYNRVRHSSKRPLLQSPGGAWDKPTYIKEIQKLLNKREPGYLKSNMIINRDGIEAKIVAGQIADYISTYNKQRK
jgi:shikimate kinase